MMEIMQNIWAAIPSALKRFVGYGVASGIALAIVLAMYLFWGTGYLQERLGTKVPSITSMARGLPFGADLQYADAVTILRSLEERRGVE